MQYEQSHSNGLTPADFQLEPTLKTQIEWTLNELEPGSSVVLLGDVEIERLDVYRYWVQIGNKQDIIGVSQAVNAVFSALFR